MTIANRAVISEVRAAFPTELEGSRLELLFGDLVCAVEEGRLGAALRLADSACRVAPGNPTCLLVHARLLIRLGAAAEAAERLKGRTEPDALIARAEALFAQGWLDDATEVEEKLLARFAADSLANLGQLAGRICRAHDGRKFPGWVGVDTKLRLVGEVRTGSHLTIACGKRVFHPVPRMAGYDGFDSFVAELPAGVSGPITVSTEGVSLLGSGLAWPFDCGLYGWVIGEDRALVGEARLDWAPTIPINLAIGRSLGGYSLVSVAATASGSLCSPFSISLHELRVATAMGSARSPIEVSVVLPDGRYAPLPGSPVVLQQTSSAPVGSRPRRPMNRKRAEKSFRKRMVDIVVPVYAGTGETLSCLERVLATTKPTEAEVVVVNDASPEATLREALARMAEDGRITLLTNFSNLGFPGAANRGMNLHSHRDVVLLNADALVFGDWLHRLRVAAYSADDIGTVTPLGEFASIASYPGKTGRPYTGAEAAEIDRVARQVNAGTIVEVPVGVGFCLFIRRACLNEVGGFDENVFGKGYGEENDFCLRARRMGWRHMAATDLFVGHLGGRSYGRTKEMLLERNRRVINTLYPGYDAMIADFVASDPLLEARRAIDMQRLLKEATNPALLMTLGLPGGVKRYVDLRESQLRTAGHTVLVLQPLEASGRNDQVCLKIQDSDFESLVFRFPKEAPILRKFLVDLGLGHIEVHHFLGVHAEALELVTSLGVDYDVYIHDYSWICPRVTLVGGDGVYCGEPPVDGCEICVRSYGAVLKELLTVRALRARSARILYGANAVIAPSGDTRRRLVRYFPGLDVQLVPWEKPSQRLSHLRTAGNRRTRVVVIGAISIQKGYQVLLECARDSAERDLNLEFVVIGYTNDDDPLLATGRVFITGPYTDNEVEGLLNREQCQVAFFPSVSPETWCFALTHALAGGLPVIAFDLGAIAERLHGHFPSRLLPLSTPAPDINDSILHFVETVHTAHAQKELVMNDPSSTNNQPASHELSASVQVLTLPPGIYAFTVQGGASSKISREELLLPALQVGLAPMKFAGTVEFLASASTLDRWLASSGDMITVRISGESASLLLTSLRSPSSSVMAIDVQRLDTNLEPADPSQVGQADVAASGSLPAQILAHIKNVGDLHFGSGRAGFIGHLWIEAFAVERVGRLAPNLIEYRGVTADGFQTPWLSNQMLCGSRGRGMPMTAYAVRLKPEIASQYDCAYTGRFASGRHLGPFKNGDLCSSDVPGDPLEAIELSVTERKMAEREVTEIEHSNVS